VAERFTVAISCINALRCVFGEQTTRGGYDTGTSAWARAGTRGHDRHASKSRFAGKTWSREPGRVRQYPLGTSMVRRGSTVRVRQRALQKPRSWGFFSRIDLHVVEHEQGMEPFMEPSGRKGGLWGVSTRRPRRPRRGGGGVRGRVAAPTSALASCRSCKRSRRSAPDRRSRDQGRPCRRGRPHR
jgi:hypothetical protein